MEHTTDGAKVDNEATEQYLTFMLGPEEYGVNILSVQEIKTGDTITPIPKTPVYIKGVINLRGAIVPVLDLRERFQIPEPETQRHEVVVLLTVSGGKRMVGAIVDDVSDVYSLRTDQIKPSPELDSAISTQFIKGIATLDNIIIVLDCDRLFGLEELSALNLLDDAAAENEIQI